MKLNWDEDYDQQAAWLNCKDSFTGQRETSRIFVDSSTRNRYLNSINILQQMEPPKFTIVLLLLACVQDIASAELQPQAQIVELYGNVLLQIGQFCKQ